MIRFFRVAWRLSRRRPGHALWWLWLLVLEPALLDTLGEGL